MNWIFSDGYKILRKMSDIWGKILELEHKVILHVNNYFHVCVLAKKCMRKVIKSIIIIKIMNKYKNNKNRYDIFCTIVAILTK